MATVQLSIEPRLLGPVSFGTVEVIQLLRSHANLGLAEAKLLVDRCVFKSETVEISMPTLESAQSLARALSLLPGKPALHFNVLG